MATDTTNYVNPNAAMQTQGLNAGQNPTGTPANSPVTPSPITTSTPSPTNTNTQGNSYTGGSIVDALKAGGQASDFASRTTLAGQYGIKNYTGTADQNTQLLQKYRTGLQSAQDSGNPAPQSQGDASAAVSDITGGATPPPPPPNPIETQMQNDPGFQQLMQDHKDYLSQENQQVSLQDEYAKLSTDAGIPALNSQLINMKSIMDGTEDDIRNEVQKAGGFATNSQVLALTSARNKVLIQNYNNLLQTRDDAVAQVNTTMGFAEKDRANAQAIASEKMNFDKQVSDYYQKFQSNAQDAYNNIIKTPGYGYQALLSSTGGDPNLVKQIETTLGLPTGGLTQLASVQQQLQQQSPDLKTQVVKLDNGSTVLINSQTGTTIRNLGGAVPTGGPGTTDPYVQAHVASILNGNETMQQVPANLRNAVVLSMNNAPKDQYSPLAASKFATAASKISANYINLPQYQLTASGLPYLQRIDAAMKSPGSVSDQDLLDSLTKLNTAGNAISDAQVRLITDGKSFSDMISSFGNKFKSGGVLSDTQRQQIQTIAKGIFANYQKGYQPVYDKAVAQMTEAGIPKAFQNIPDLNNLSAQIDNGKYGANPPAPTIPPDIDSALAKTGVVNEGTKTVTIPRSTWSTFGSNMDNVLQAIQAKGYQLLVK